MLARAAGEGIAGTVEGRVVSLPVPDADAARRLLQAHGEKVRDFEFRHGSMDDVFLAVTSTEEAAS